MGREGIEPSTLGLRVAWVVAISSVYGRLSSLTCPELGSEMLSSGHGSGHGPHSEDESDQDAGSADHALTTSGNNYVRSTVGLRLHPADTTVWRPRSAGSGVPPAAPRTPADEALALDGSDRVSLVRRHSNVSVLVVGLGRRITTLPSDSALARSETGSRWCQRLCRGGDPSARPRRERVRRCEGWSDSRWGSARSPTARSPRDSG